METTQWFRDVIPNNEESKRKENGSEMEARVLGTAPTHQQCIIGVISRALH